MTPPPGLGIGQWLILAVLSALPLLTALYFWRANRASRAVARTPSRRPQLPSAESRLPDDPSSAATAVLILTPRVRGNESGLPWLPALARPDLRPLELHVLSDWPADRVAAEGAPSPDLFIIGRIAAPAGQPIQGARHVLHVRAQPGTCVAGADLAGRVPPAVAARLSAADYLVPAGWLDRVLLTGGHTLDTDGSRPIELAPTALMLRPAGARHGIDGLPDDVARASGGPTTAYARLTGERSDAVAVSLRLPEPEPGLRVAEIRLDGSRLIDVEATARRLAGLAFVRSRIDELAHLSYVLGRSTFSAATVTAVLSEDGGRWRTQPAPAGQTLAHTMRAASAQ